VIVCAFAIPANAEKKKIINIAKQCELSFFIKCSLTLRLAKGFCPEKITPAAAA